MTIPVRTDGSPGSILSLVFTCIVIAVPFTASGVCVALALTKFPRQVSRLYATDLAGASLGCILLIALLRITDGPTAVFAVALFALLGAGAAPSLWCFLIILVKRQCPRDRRAALARPGEWLFPSTII